MKPAAEEFVHFFAGRPGSLGAMLAQLLLHGALGPVHVEDML